LETTTAILLRRHKLSETSLVVTWLAETCGKIKTVAKGARRPRSPFAGKLDLFYEADIQFVRSRRSDLHTLKEAVLREPFEGLRLDFHRVELASYFVELLDLVTEPDHPAPDLLDLLRRALGYLNINAPDLRALLHFEAELARLAGVHGAPGVTPAVAIGRLFGRLPSARPALLKRLEKTK
jgi:DNA repair protein RecO (recombination protein O)